MISESLADSSGPTEENQDIFDNKFVMAVVKEIYSSLTFDSHKLKAVMNLPPVSQVDNETLSLALQYILENYFHLSFPSQKLIHVKTGRSIKFIEEQPEENLPPRRVSILLSPEHRCVEVNGVEEENGKDGYSELLFNWQSQAGQVDNYGNIDLKRLNTYPHVAAEQPLVTIYLRTEGTPGVNSLGKKIKQRMGQPLKVKFNEVVIYQKDDPKDNKKYQLVARKGGIVEYTLSRKKDPGSLVKIDVLDTITIKGDVNYAIGDQGSLTSKDLECTSNIVVKGNVLGVFSLQSTGFIHISGSFEGKKAVGEEIDVEVITSGSRVVAKSNAVASNVIRAVVEGKTIIVKKNANEATLLASERILLDESASCLALSLHTRKLESVRNRFAGRTTLYLGEDLFNRERELLASLQIGEEEIAKKLPELKEAASTTVNALTGIELRIKEAGGLQYHEVKQLLTVIKQMLVAAIQNMAKPLDERLIPSCYSLQALLGERKVHESVLRKIESFVNTLKKFNEILGLQAEKVKSLQKSKSDLAALQEEAQQLWADFQGPTFVGNNAEIRVLCGEAELHITPEAIPGKHFAVTYQLEEGAVGLRNGTLMVVSENLENF